MPCKTHRSQFAQRPRRGMDHGFRASRAGPRIRFFVHALLIPIFVRRKLAADFCQESRRFLGLAFPQEQLGANPLRDGGIGIGASQPALREIELGALISRPRQPIRVFQQRCVAGLDGFQPGDGLLLCR